MKILFVFFTDPPRPFSTSVAALAAVARAAGHEVDALEVWRKSAIAETVNAIERRRPDVIALSAMSRDWPGASALLSRQRTGAFVVVGGYHATLASADVAACDAVDAICIGEGERPLAALLEARARPKASLPGLWVRGADGWTGAPPPASPEPDIGRLLPWDYDVFGDVRAMLRAGVNTFGPHVDGFLPTRASRGCPFACAYCSAPAWGDVGGFSNAAMVNTRPVAQLCDELASLRERYEPEGFEFWDEHFPISIRWLDELAREYPRRVGLPFKVEMHPSAASRARLERLAEAGCVLFHCGIEAGDQALRREVLNRRTRDAELERVFDDCRDLGLETSASLMTMLPGETREQMRSTASLLKRLRPGSFMWSTYQPLPGTPLGEAAVEVWPAPARERFDDHPPVESRTPARVSDAEREETFHELAELQAALIEDPDRARPVDIPATLGAVSDALAALLGRSDVQRARWEAGILVLEMDGMRRIEIGPNDGSPCYRATARLRLSYRGREAPPALLAAIDDIAARVAALGIGDLARAFEGP